jgi:long-chain acyl-CoA synthetase
MVKNMSVFRPHAMLMVPLMIETIFKRIDANSTDENRKEVAQKIFGGRLRYIFTGGAHLDDYYLNRFQELDIKVLEGYGMSECSPVISANTPVDYKFGSVGKPLSNVEIAFSDEGEILVKGTSVMKQYYNMPTETSEAIQDGWLHTGDKGYMDEDGFLFINGRIKNLIILSNGENVSPEEMENKLALSPLIGEVVVVGRANGLAAVVYPDPDVVSAKGLDADAVRAGIQEFLDEFNKSQPTYRHIVGLEIRETPFERSSTKKIKRNLV